MDDASLERAKLAALETLDSAEGTLSSPSGNYSTLVGGVLHIVRGLRDPRSETRELAEEAWKSVGSARARLDRALFDTELQLLKLHATIVGVSSLLTPGAREIFTDGVLADATGRVMRFHWSLPNRKILAERLASYDDAAQTAFADGVAIVFGSVITRVATRRDYALDDDAQEQIGAVGAFQWCLAIASAPEWVPQAL